ncbi:MAG: acylneuraminate cytidylyltransferase [Spirochaetales bacterium]|nr:acylneuraminate cytidylyltransferase [Spirochaetales bacterium]
MGTAGKLTALFLQARIDSTRLPGKVLLSLSGRRVIEHAMLALREIPADRHVLLTDHAGYEALKPFTETCGFDLYRGPKDDVLARYAGAARQYGADRIIRATGDNPLVDPFLAADILRRHGEAGAHYSAYVGAPLGTGVEVVEAEALFRAEAEGRDPYEREHVTPFVYRRPEEFVIYRPRVPEPQFFPEGRVTLDTEADYAFLRIVFSRLYDGRPVSADTLVRWLKSPEGRRAASGDRAAS